MVDGYFATSGLTVGRVSLHFIFNIIITHKNLSEFDTDLFGIVTQLTVCLFRQSHQSPSTGTFQGLFKAPSQNLNLNPAFFKIYQKTNFKFLLYT